jgi:hypothetical protein
MDFCINLGARRNNSKDGNKIVVRESINMIVIQVLSPGNVTLIS